MKTIFNILVILIVAMLIGGLFYGAVTLTSTATGQASIHERPLGGDFPSDRDESAGGVQIPVDMIKNLVIIFVVAVGYLNAVKFFGRKKISLQANT